MSGSGAVTPLLCATEASQARQGGSNPAGNTSNSSRPLSGTIATQQDSSPMTGSPQHTGPLPFSKRARQIQEESGVTVPLSSSLSPRNSVSSGHYRPPALRESISFTLESLNEVLCPSQGQRSNRHSIGAVPAPSTSGRNRAGTLPSSWSGQGENLLPARPAERKGTEVLPASRSSNSSPLLPGEVSESSASAYANGEYKRGGSISSTASSNLNRKLTAGPSSLSLAQGIDQSPAQSPNRQSYSTFAPADHIARFRTGSLASGLSTADPFGSGIFSSSSSGWPDRTRAQSTQLTGRPMGDVRGRGATIGHSSRQSTDANDMADTSSEVLERERIMMQNLGLGGSDINSHSNVDATTGPILAAGNAAGESRYSISSSASSAAGRDRATTLSAASTRPRVEGNNARNRSSSFAPNQIFGNYSIDEESAVPTIASGSSLSVQDAVSPLLGFAQHGGLANSALKQRLSMDFAHNRQSGRNRATSLSVLGTEDRDRSPLTRIDCSTATHPRSSERQQSCVPDAQSASWMALSPSSQNFSSDIVSQDDLYAYAVANGLDPIAFAEVAASQGVVVAPSSTANRQEEFGRPTTTMRLRAGTVATLGSGASSRMRAEQELMRISGAGPAASEGDMSFNALYPRPYTTTSSPTRPSLADQHRRSGSPDRITTATVQPSASHPPPRSQNHQQPTRSLWIGNLDVSTTGQELMQAFAPYGAIESLRLLPEKECGFVNYVETADAIRAREDVLNRLGGKIKPTGTGPNGTVRVGFGKIDSAPESAPQAHAQVGGGGLSSPRPGKFRPVSPSDGASLTPGGGERDESLPTRALWIGSIPSTTTPAMLLSVFQPYGPIESARVLTHKNCGFINFERVDDAVRARKMLNGRDVLGTEVGAVRVGFAKVPSKPADDVFPGDPASEGYANALDSLDRLKGAGAVPAERQALAGNLENYRSTLVTELLGQKHTQQQNLFDEQSMLGGMHLPSALALSHTRSASHSGLSASNSIVPSSDKGGVPLPAELQPRPSVTDLQLLMEELSSEDPVEDQEVHLAAVRRFRPPATYYTSIPLVSEVSNSRRFDSTKLRDIRKSIESGQYSQADVDNIATGFLESIVDLASDYIGNTVVQKFFEKCSEPFKTAMLQRIAPSLATIGIHKNGTWSAQKIIDVAQSPEQRSLIAQHLRPYIPPLLLDQFGNYVVQCLLPYGNFSEAGEHRTGSDFIIDAMTDRCWEIAQGRFGARSMRACLESPKVTKLQCKRVAIAVVLNSVPLATSPNGSILLTWLLDASELPGRYKLLAPRFTPHLTHLCTHKLALLTVLRLINQDLEPEASTRITDALFQSPNDATLEEILTDQVHGSQFITKVLQSAHIDAENRKGYCEQVKKIVREHRLMGVPAYRKLIEDLGLPFSAQHTRSGGGTGGSTPSSGGYAGSSPNIVRSPNMLSVADGVTGYPTSAQHYPAQHLQQDQEQQYVTVPASLLASMGNGSSQQYYTQYHQPPSLRSPPQSGGRSPRRGLEPSPSRDAFNPWPAMSSSPASTSGSNSISSPPPMRIGGKFATRSPLSSGPAAVDRSQQQQQQQHSSSSTEGYVATTGY